MLRKVSGLEKVDTLAVLDQVSQTSWVDTCMAQRTAYVYRVTVVNASGLEVRSNEWTARPMQLPAVQIQRLDFDSRTATASLQWTPYTGGKSAACQVRRRTEELAAQALFETRERAITSFADSHLVGATEYYYQVVVLTDRGEEAPSAERSGSIHPALESWPLEVEEGNRVRLYREPGDRIAALIADGHRVRLRFFTPEGQFLEEQVLLDLPKLWGDLSPRFMDTVLGPQGQRFLSLVSTSIGGFILGILAWGEDLPERSLTIDDLPGALSGTEGAVLGQLSLDGTFDNVSLSAGGRRLWTEDFSAFPEGEVEGARQGWAFRGRAKIQNGWLFNAAGARLSAESWRDFRVEADAINSSSFSQAVIRAGGDSLSRFALRLEQSNQRVVLEWGPTLPGQANPAPRISVVRPCTLMVGVPYRLTLEVADGQARAAVQSRVFWSEVPKKGDIWTSLDAVGNALLTVNNQPYTIGPRGGASKQPSLGAKVSQVRYWEDNLAVPWIGICLPEVNQIKLGSFPRGLPSTWSSFLIAPPLGPSAGPAAGFMSYPLSFDVGPDGRIFVLDAGNSRILVFDPERRYLTQWGRRGSGPGEFDFGEGRNKGDELDLAGSVVVDGEGYIYVADVVNRRIQRFAP